MTATVHRESRPSSRRALLAGALGGLGAWAMAAIGRANPVRAGVDGDVVLGADNPAAAMTSITNSTNNAIVFEASNGQAGTALYGNSGSGYGVYGNSSSYVGVRGNSGSNIGLYGHSSAPAQPASVGQSVGNSTGVQGYSGSGSLPAAKAKTGMYGYAAQDSNSNGVYGESPTGRGVHGKASTGYGGYFEGKVYSTKWYELAEISTPPNPIASRARLFIRDNGLGKTQLCVKFANGTSKVLATES